MRLGFSTLGTPGWTLEQTCRQARRLGYDGIELRLLDGELVTPAAVPEAVRARVRETLATSGMAVSALASSVQLAGPDTDATATDLRAGLALAADWSIPVVRVFGGRVPTGEPRPAAVRRAAALVTAVLPEAARLGVRIALETHHDFSAGADAAALLAAVADPSFVAIWDLQHTWRAGDQPRQAWDALGPHLVEIQVKDGRPTPDGRWRQTHLGDGEVPVRDCLAVALAGGFDGWLVAEWEKFWHPDLDEPELALPAHRTALVGMLTDLRDRC